MSVAGAVESCKMAANHRRAFVLMRNWLLAFLICAVSIAVTHAQEDKKADDLKPADPDTGESTVEEATLGLLPNPFEKQGVEFAITYIGEGMGNPTGGEKHGAVYEDRINFATDVDFEKLVGLKQLMPTFFKLTVAACPEVRSSTTWTSAVSRPCRPRASTKSGSNKNGERNSRYVLANLPPIPSS